MKLKPEQEESAFKLLKIIPLFSECPPEALRAMVPMLDAREIPAGKVVLMDQEIGRALFLLVAGTVGVWKRVGSEKKRLAGLEGPDFFGERSMFEESPVSAQIKTEEACHFWVLERPAFDQIATAFPGILGTIQTNLTAIRKQRIVPIAPKRDPEGI